jgi:hypothetical protein
MLVEESRILQVSSVNALQNNLANIKFSALLYQVMTIADEVDSQLMQTMDCHVMESTIHAAGVRVGGVNEPATRFWIPVHGPVCQNAAPILGSSEAIDGNAAEQRPYPRHLDTRAICWT